MFKKIIIVISILIIPNMVFSFEIENTADNPRLVNITKQQLKDLKNVEKRIFDKSYEGENTIDRLERLELNLFHGIQKGSATQRLNTLKLESMRACIRGTAMTPMMMDTFNTRYINPRGEGIIYHDDVGIIDGLIKAFWPDFYNQISEYREFKEANFY